MYHGGMAANHNRQLQVLRHALHEFEQAAERGETNDDVAGQGLAVLDEIDRNRRKWLQQIARGEKKRPSDLDDAASWLRRWLLAAEKINHPALTPAMAKARTMLDDDPPTS
jgi:hypothetical protein